MTGYFSVPDLAWFGMEELWSQHCDALVGPHKKPFSRVPEMPPPSGWRLTRVGHFGRIAPPQTLCRHSDGRRSTHANRHPSMPILTSVHVSLIHHDTENRISPNSTHGYGPTFPFHPDTSKETKRKGMQLKQHKAHVVQSIYGCGCDGTKQARTETQEPFCNLRETAVVHVGEGSPPEGRSHQARAERTSRVVQPTCHVVWNTRRDPHAVWPGGCFTL